jgi:hypothetical protein
MKLGLCYMVFDGHELLEFAARSIRSQVDHISITYQDISYFGNPAGPELKSTVERLKNDKLIDEIILFEPNLKLHHKENELKLRNIGLNASRQAGCTHHISADVDELYLPEQLKYVKEAMNGYDFCMVPYEVYYKKPTYLITPSQNLSITLIHPVDNPYEINKEFPFKVEITRRLAHCDKYKVFTKEEMTIHHMSYVRKNIRKKLDNNDNGQFYKKEKFIANFENYQVGGRVCIIPDFLNRRTIEVENIFDINLEIF